MPRGDGVIVNKEAYRLYDPISMELGYDHRKGFYKVTRYRSKDQKFVIAIPEHMQGVLERKQVMGDNQDEVNKKFRRRMAEYNLRIKQKKRVILYQLLGNIQTQIDGKPFAMHSLKLYGQEKALVAGLGLWYAVCWETYTENEGKKWYVDDGSKVDKPDYQSHWDSMDYTEEREAFFKELKRRIEKLTHGAYTFLTKKDDLIHLIDHKMQLPILKGEDEK